MKKIVLMAMMIATGYSATAQDEIETTISGDIVSSYVWRGQDLGSAAVQPTLGVGYKGLSLTAWGIKWNAYMNGSSDTMPDTFCIDGRVSPKSFYEYDVGEFKNAARKCGFAEDQITSLLIFDDPVSINGVFATIAAAAALVVLTFLLIKNRRNDKGYY